MRRMFSEKQLREIANEEIDKGFDKRFESESRYIYYMHQLEVLSNSEHYHICTYSFSTSLDVDTLTGDSLADRTWQLLDDLANKDQTHWINVYCECEEEPTHTGLYELSHNSLGGLNLCLRFLGQSGSQQQKVTAVNTALFFRLDLITGERKRYEI